MRIGKLSHKLLLLAAAVALAEGGLVGYVLHSRTGGALNYSVVLLCAGLGALVTILLGLIVVRQVTRPLEQLSSAAREIGQGNLDAEVQVAAGGEIGDLATAFRDMQGRLGRTYHDLERLVAERTADLSKTTDLLNSILDSSTEYAIIATDIQRHILTFNEGARRLFGYGPEAVGGERLERLVAPESVEEVLGGAVDRDLRSHGRHECEATCLRADGERFPARVVTTIRFDEADRPAGYTLLARDITQRRALEQRLRQYTDNLEAAVAEKTARLREMNTELIRANRMKGQFLANMSHEVRTPLNSIIGFAEALRDGVAGQTSPEQREFAEDIYEAGHQLLAMINDVLDLAQFEAGVIRLKLEPCELGNTVDEVMRVVKGLARRKGVALKTDVEPRPLELTADPLKLKQILYNLLSNAIKFTATDGEVSVHGRHDTETVVIRVADTGIGIAPEDQVTIFEEFHQVESGLSRKPEGSGLGLALTKRLVEMHGGEIGVESEIGKGTTFIVTLLRDLVTRAETD